MAEPTELWRRIARAGTQIDPGLSERDVERLVGGARRLARRRALRRGGAAALLAVMAAGSFGLVAYRRQPADVAVGKAGGDVRTPAAFQAPAPTAGSPDAAPPSRSVQLAPGLARVLRLSDGSTATPLDPGTELTVRQNSDRRVTIDLQRGRGRFEVTPRPQRAFVVRAGDVGVTVLGTIFRVERVADRIGVEVERGRVLVEWGSGSRTLVAGQGGWFPPLQGGTRSRLTRPVAATRVTPRAASPGSLSVPPPPEETLPTPPPPPVAAAVVVPAPRSASGSASPAAVAPSPSAREASVEWLLAAADAARVDGRAADAVGLLRQAIDRHGSDRRAPLAAFTLGRVLLRELARPREAAAAFAQARALAPHGAFAEDALAREVEAWAKANEPVQARTRADEYRRLYPAGRRAAAVRTFGGAE